MNMSILDDRFARANDAISRYLPREAVSVTDDAVCYSVLAGGKRLRPIFLLSVFDAFCSDAKAAELAECFAAALEFIHTYSLVHDDLPDMDNDLLRRGKPTTHAKYGAAMGILAGDALLTEAFVITSEKLKKFAAEGESELVFRGVKALNILSSCAGKDGMILGQEIDLKSEGTDVTSDTVLKMYELKTSRLLEAAFGIGAVLGGADDEAVSHCIMAARNLGIAFQICDDILDVKGDEQKLGKPVNSDEKNDKRTFLAIEGEKKAEETAAEYTEGALNEIRSLKKDTGFIEWLMLELLKRER